MDESTRRFIENATLLFIASRSSEGHMDVSPRGGQPCVLRISDSGKLLLPDYQGNRRLDTIGNLIDSPRMAIAVLNRNSDSYLHITATAEVSFQRDHLAAFPADENPPLSVLEITPDGIEWIKSVAFAKAGLWLDGERRKAPLDLGAIIKEDNRAQAAAGLSPVFRDVRGEDRLSAMGVREVYGTSSELVRTKVYEVAGPAGLEFIKDAGFIVLAQEAEDGCIRIDLSGEKLSWMTLPNGRQVYRLGLPPGVRAGAEGECALAIVEPGRSELLRINGRFERDQRNLDIEPREVFFHCSAAFARSRVWQSDRRTYWTGKRRFTCVERRRESPDVVSFVLSPLDEAPLGSVTPGQYITAFLKDSEGELRQRSYSVSARPGKRSLRISVRRTGGKGLSDLLHDRVQPGDELLLNAPAGRFVLSSPPNRPVVLVSAGVGMTPLLPMLEQLAEENSSRAVWFIHAARDGAHHLFADEARSIVASATHGAIRLISFYSRPRGEDKPSFVGRIDAARLADIVPVETADFYLCGPETFMTSLREGLVSRGAAAENVRFEVFAAASPMVFDLSDTSHLGGHEVTFARAQRSATWTPRDGFLLDFAIRNGIDVSYSCRVGDCQSCVQRLLSGVIDYPLGEMPMLAQDHILLCQAVPRGDLSIDC